LKTKKGYTRRIKRSARIKTTTKTRRIITSTLTKSRLIRFNIVNNKKKKIMLNKKEKQKLGKDLALIIVSIGGIITLSYAVYFIVDTLKKWY